MGDYVFPRLPLGEILSVVETGTRPPGGSSCSSFGVPSLGGENLRLDGSLNLDSIRRIPGDFFSSMHTGHLKSWDVLINKDGAQSGKVARYSGEFRQAAINEHLFLLRGTGAIHQDYLYHLIRSDETQRTIRSLITGSAQPGLNRSIFHKTLVSLPVLAEQRQIATILNTIDEAIHTTEYLVARHRRIQADLATELLSKVKRSNDWARISLGEIAVLSAGATPPRGNASYWADDGHPWATIADLKQDPVFTTNETVSEVGRQFAGRIVKAGTLLMSFKLTIGRVAKAGIDLQTNEAIVMVRGKSGIVEDDWLYYALPDFIATGVTDDAVKGVTLNQAKLRALTAKLPSLEEQRRIAEILDSADKTIRAYERERDKLKQIRSGLAADLLSGRVRTVSS